MRTCARVGSRLCLSENEGECYAESCCRSVCLDQPVRSERVSLESFGRVFVVVCVCGHRTECELCVCVCGCYLQAHLWRSCVMDGD